MLRLYGELFCAHLEVELKEVVLYRLSRDAVVRKHALQLFSSEASRSLSRRALRAERHEPNQSHTTLTHPLTPFTRSHQPRTQVRLSVVDNLLLAHALDSQVILLFDLRLNEKAAIAAPLPLRALASDGFGALYSPHWIFAAPRYVIDPQAGRAGTLELDLRAISASSIDTCCLLQFLLHRADGAEVILQVLCGALEQQESLATCARMFDVLSGAHAAATRAAADAAAEWADGSTTGDPPPGGLVSEALACMGARAPPSPPPSPQQLVQGVFEPVAAAIRREIPGGSADTRCRRRRHLIGAAVEYMASLDRYTLPPSDELSLLLVELFEAEESHFQICQLVQHNMLADSPALAAKLLELARPPTTSLALDMLARLGDTHALLGELIKQGELLGACRFIREQRLAQFPPRALLAMASSRAGEQPALLPAVIRFFEQRNQALRGSPAFLPEEGCDAFLDEARRRGVWRDKGSGWRAA